MDATYKIRKIKYLLCKTKLHLDLSKIKVHKSVILHKHPRNNLIHGSSNIE